VEWASADIVEISGFITGAASLNFEEAEDDRFVGRIGIGIEFPVEWEEDEENVVKMLSSWSAALHGM
jgi:hypothetical protein